MLNDKIIERVADAVISRIEELRQIDEIAQAILRQLRGAPQAPLPLFAPGGAGALAAAACSRARDGRTPGRLATGQLEAIALVRSQRHQRFYEQLRSGQRLRVQEHTGDRAVHLGT